MQLIVIIGKKRRICDLHKAWSSNIDLGVQAKKAKELWAKVWGINRGRGRLLFQLWYHYPYANNICCGNIGYTKWKWEENRVCKTWCGEMYNLNTLDKHLRNFFR